MFSLSLLLLTLLVRCYLILFVVLFWAAYFYGLRGYIVYHRHDRIFSHRGRRSLITLILALLARNFTLVAYILRELRFGLLFNLLRCLRPSL